jgi:hypothetical protein
MACVAFAIGNGFVDGAFREQYFFLRMTVVAKIAALSHQQILIHRTVGIVAASAVAFFDRRMEEWGP